jgi:hypothetical protein
MGNAESRRARSGTQAAWAGTNYSDAKIRDQLRLPKMSLPAIVNCYILNGKYTAV